tara:strand:- start:345 stop:869 length:525 start_codon:yes stop_codon:yes gene_type:complete
MKQLILFILLSYSVSIFSQEERVEKVYQDCAYNSLADKGQFLKKQVKQYEAYLITKGFLKDSTANSYYQLLKSFPTRRIYPSVYDYSFFDSVKINSSETKKVFPFSKKCSEKIIEHDGHEMLYGKIKAATLVGGEDIKETLKVYAEILKEDDFHLDYYKVQTLFFTQLLNFTID